MEFNQLPNEFYPTPPELAAKMVNCKFLKGKIETILEPSAGKGDLIDFFMLAKEYLTNRWYCRSIWEKDMSIPDNEVFDAVIERYVLPVPGGP